MIRSTTSRRSRRTILSLAPVVALATLGCRSSEAPTMTAVTPPTGLAVLNSDYNTTSLSVVDPTTNMVVHDACVDSSTVAPTLSLVLSGDVQLPSHPQTGGGDRAPRQRQQRADLGRSAGLQDQPPGVNRRLPGASPRHDLGQLDQGVRDPFRHQPDADRRPDVAGRRRIDRQPRRRRSRPSSGGSTWRPTPRPWPVRRSRRARTGAFLIGDKLYVTLGSQNSDYVATGIGRVVEIDTTTDQVSGMIDIPSLAGCARMEYVAATQTLYVVCGGASSAADQESQTSGIARIDLSGAAPSDEGHAAGLLGRHAAAQLLVGRAGVGSPRPGPRRSAHTIPPPTRRVRPTRSGR